MVLGSGKGFWGRWQSAIPDLSDDYEDVSLTIIH